MLSHCVMSCSCCLCVTGGWQETLQGLGLKSTHSVSPSHPGQRFPSRGTRSTLNVIFRLKNAHWLFPRWEAQPIWSHQTACSGPCVSTQLSNAWSLSISLSLCGGNREWWSWWYWHPHAHLLSFPFDDSFVFYYSFFDNTRKQVVYKRHERLIFPVMQMVR